MTVWNQISFESRLSDRNVAVRLGEVCDQLPEFLVAQPLRQRVCRGARPDRRRRASHDEDQRERRHEQRSELRHHGRCRPCPLAAVAGPRLSTLCPLNGVPQRLHRRLGPGEQPLGKPRVLQHVRVDRPALVEVQAHAGQVLQPQVAVVVDLRVLEPRRQIRRVAGVGREQVDGRVEADLAQRLRDLRVLRARRSFASIASRSILVGSTWPISTRS